MYLLILLSLGLAMNAISEVVWFSPEAIKNYAEVLAILVGGVWAVWRFCLRRERDTALDIALSQQSVPRADGSFLVFLDVMFTNRGAVRVTARRKRYPAYDDDSESLNFSGSLVIRELPDTAPVGAQVRWFATASDRSPRQTDIEADLLDDCELTGETDFWMEPGECSHSGVAIILRAGAYAAMVTFVGAAGDHEFWRRIFLIRVPYEAPQLDLPSSVNA
jgi:hypothetical protein